MYFYHSCITSKMINYEVVYTDNYRINHTTGEQIHNTWQLINVYDDTMPLRDAIISYCPFCGARLTEKCSSCGFIYDGRPEEYSQMECEHSNIEGYELSENVEKNNHCWNCQIQPNTCVNDPCKCLCHKEDKK